MKYLLLICAEGDRSADVGPADVDLAGADQAGTDQAGTDPAGTDQAGTDPAGTDPTAWVDEMTSRGVRLFGQALAPPSTATTVRVRDGRRILTDGPFAETKEIVCGFDLIECEDLDEAIEIAAKHPQARRGMIEVRPLWTPRPLS